MKKTLIIMIAVMLLAGVSGCGSSPEGQKGTAAPATQSAGLSVEQEAWDEMDQANASMIATAINTYNALKPEETLTDNVTLAEAKEALEGLNIWPPNVSDADAERAWGLIEIEGGVAEIIEIG